tara:strand:+ start:345 stop:614 length:270 start_codon:yes stop_codon:yes gene_type:complete
MKELIESNYQSIVDRGLISPFSNVNDFLIKALEEVDELCKAWKGLDKHNQKEELADVIMVCLNMAKHYDIDIEQEIKNKIEVNKKRALK